MEDRNMNRRKIITAAAVLPLLGAESADARAESGTDICVEFLREYQRRAAVLDGRQLPISSADDAWLAEPLNELVATPATTARDFAAKIVAHAHLLGITEAEGTMSIVEASAIRDARALLGASAA
jgi:hypothetical protein